MSEPLAKKAKSINNRANAANTSWALEHGNIVYLCPDPYIFKDCRTLSQCIDVMATYDMTTITTSLKYLMLELSQGYRNLELVKPYKNDRYLQVQNAVYLSMSMLFSDNFNTSRSNSIHIFNHQDPSQENLDLYVSRTKAALKLLKYYGWDFKNPFYSAELLGYYAIHRYVTYETKKVMLKTYLDLCDGRDWINRNILTPSGNHEYTTTLCFLCLNNLEFDARYPRDMFINVLKYGADPNVVYENNATNTCLYLACDGLDGWLARKLLEAGAKLNGNSASYATGIATNFVNACNDIQRTGTSYISYLTINDLADARECCLAMLDHGLDILLPETHVFQIYKQRNIDLEAQKERYERQRNRKPKPFYCDCIGVRWIPDDCECSEHDCECSQSDFGYSDDEDNKHNEGNTENGDNSIYYDVNRSVEYSYLNYGVHPRSSFNLELWRFGDMLLCKDKLVLDAIYRRIVNRRIRGNTIIKDDAEYLYWLLITESVLAAKINNRCKIDNITSIKWINTIQFRTKLHQLINQQIVDMVVYSVRQ